MRFLNMRNWKILSLPSYFQALMHSIKELSKINVQEDAYRIVDISKDQSGQVILTIQLIGKTTIFKTTPEKIVQDEFVINRFSRADVCTVTYLICQQEAKPKLKIHMQEFCTRINRMIFSILKKRGGDIEKKTASELSENKHLLNSLSQEDAHLVGYTIATEHMLKEKELMKKLKSKNKEN